MHKFSMFVDNNPSYRSSTCVPVTLTANYDLLSILFIFQPVLGLFKISIALSFFFMIYLKCSHIRMAYYDIFSFELFTRSTSKINYSIFLFSNKNLSFFYSGKNLVDFISYFSKYIYH